MPTISSQLTRIKQEKEELKTALEAKGIEVSDDCKIGDLTDYIEIIPSNKMYVCTAVDKATRTWEGQEAILMGDDSYRYYTFSDTVTTGLKYTSVNPAPGEGWNENCCMRMNSIFQGISTNGLMLYGCWGNGSALPGIQYGHAAMDINITNGLVSASTEIQGVIVAEYKNVTGVSQTNTGITGNQPMTIATWYQDIGGTADTLILGLGSKSANKGLFLCSHNGYAAYNLGGTTVSTGVLVNDKLHHICLVYTGSAIGVYIDGELAYQAAVSISLTDSPFFFGGNISGTAGSISGFTNMHAYIKHSYVYTRVLSDFDVRALANEEWPKKEPGLILEVISGSITFSNPKAEEDFVTETLDSSIGPIRLDKDSSDSTSNKYCYDGNNELLTNIGITSGDDLFIMNHPVQNKPALYIGGTIYAVLCESFDELMTGYTYTTNKVTLQITQDSSL